MKTKNILGLAIALSCSISPFAMANNMANAPELFLGSWQQQCGNRSNIITYLNSRDVVMTENGSVSEGTWSIKRNTLSMKFNGKRKANWKIERIGATDFVLVRNSVHCTGNRIHNAYNPGNSYYPDNSYNPGHNSPAVTLPGAFPVGPSQGGGYPGHGYPDHGHPVTPDLTYPTGSGQHGNPVTPDGAFPVGPSHGNSAYPGHGYPVTPEGAFPIPTTPSYPSGSHHPVAPLSNH